ncbi:MAG TPA: cell wall hydrolase [Caulobacteraceae bacterium]|nr:cell wall hydrolase [Caulobacteraceae bacterium]
MPPAARLTPAIAAALAVLGGCATVPEEASPKVRALAAEIGGFSPRGEARLERGMDASMLSLARRLEPGRRTDYWGRMPGWAVLDVSTPPSLGLTLLTPEDAQRLNALLPYAALPTVPALPFVLPARGAERDRAVLCLTQAIYYEAALEPEAGQEAVAQTVINRVRHPAFPKSICGVVYQGSQLVTGCQFSFTCDGSRERPPMAEYWNRAKAVAERALSGFVQPVVGTATYYHADYVFPRWGPTLVKIVQVGAHIFYRFPGPAGKPDSFTGRYAGGELKVSMEGPSPEAIAAAKAAAAGGELPVGGAAVIDPTAPGAHMPVPGQTLYGRRIPTKDEIARINAALAAYEAKSAPPDPGAPGAGPSTAPLITPPPPVPPRPRDDRPPAAGGAPP